MSELEDKVKARQNKTRDAIARHDAGEQSKPEKRPVKKPKPKPKVGVGKPSFDVDAAVAKIEAQIKRTKDPAMIAKLKARQQALRDNQ